MKKRIEVVGAVLVHDGKILAARRGPGRSMAGYWEFPGGKIELGESPEQALHRELSEELRIEATVDREITTTDHEYDFGIVSLKTFGCSVPSKEVTLTEHVEVRWLAPHDLMTVEWAPADIPTVKILMS